MHHSSSRPSSSLVSLLSLLSCALLVVGCGSAAAEVTPNPVTVSELLDVVGVPDRGLDPSVVAVTTPWGGECSGVLLASDVVLTARRCVTAAPAPLACDGLEIPAPPTADPETLRIYTDVPGPSVSWVSAGVAVLTSDAPILCGADVALIVLGWPITGAVASVVGTSGIAEGAYVRTVGLGRASASAPVEELLREHLPVLDVSASELAVAEATCVGQPGEVAFDEETGVVVGLLSRWGSLCGGEGQFDVFTRTDAFYDLIQDALAWEPALASAAAGAPGLDGGVAERLDAGKKRDAAKAKKPATDVGASCSTAGDCGTGLCVTTEGAGEYCSRTCSLADRCPTDYKCVIATGGQSVCVLL